MLIPEGSTSYKPEMMAQKLPFCELPWYYVPGGQQKGFAHVLCMHAWPLSFSHSVQDEKNGQLICNATVIISAAIIPKRPQTHYRELVCTGSGSVLVYTGPYPHYMLLWIYSSPLSYSLIANSLRIVSMSFLPSSAAISAQTVLDVPQKPPLDLHRDHPPPPKRLFIRLWTVVHERGTTARVVIYSVPATTIFPFPLWLPPRPATMKVYKLYSRNKAPHKDWMTLHW